MESIITGRGCRHGRRGVGIGRASAKEKKEMSREVDGWMDGGY